MEHMDISLDKFYKFIYGHLNSSIPEDILGKITVAVSILIFNPNCMIYANITLFQTEEIWRNDWNICTIEN